jgi:transcriptional regulator with PAS, ATPase and Fis domain
MDIQSIKQRFGITGHSVVLDRAINVAVQVAPTDISVMVTGESGVGKEVFPKIIHHLSARKHGPFIAVNCGAIPEGTIDSELFGHEKGSFTGAHEARRGYFEVVNNGTIFLDEVAELPLLTQVRLLRVLETGEFIKVGSSKVLKTNVRVVAATNINLQQAINQGKFREDLFYRLNTVPIYVPPLRERQHDIIMLFKKFSSDFAEKYRMPPIQLDNESEHILLNYRWPGNIRQLKNVAEQISVIENNRLITPEVIYKYLPNSKESNLPVLFHDSKAHDSGLSERDILYKILFELRRDVADLKKVVQEIGTNGHISGSFHQENHHLIKSLYKDDDNSHVFKPEHENRNDDHHQIIDSFEEDSSNFIEESLSIQKKEKDLILRALHKYDGKRKKAADELGISERTLYRKIREYEINS